MNKILLKFRKRALACLSVFSILVMSLTSAFGGTNSNVVASGAGEAAGSNWKRPENSAVAGITYAGGNGTKSKPYIIETADQLYKAVYEEGKIIGSSAGAYFSVTKDIDLSNAGWVPGSWDKLSNPAYGFIGVIEGNGHTVSRLKVEDVTPAGLIWKAGNGATIKNLHIKDSSILAYHYAGAFMGYVEGTSTSSIISVIGCTVQNTNVKGNWTGGFLGVATNSTVIVSNCAFKSGTITAMDSKKLYGGIIADGFCPVNVRNCYSVGYYAVPKTANTAGFICENVYTDKSGGLTGQTVLIIDQMKGDTAKNNMSFDWERSWQTVAADFPMPKINTASEEVIPWTVPPEAEVADIAYAGGTGVSRDPYIIETGDQLYKAVYEDGKNEKGAAAYFSITKDIDLSNAGWVSGSWDKLSNSDYGFIGVLEGNGHVISHLKSENVTPAGLIWKAGAGATIKNLHIKDSSILAYHYAGAFIGYCQGTSTASRISISGCTVQTTNVKGNWAGGFLGVATNSTVEISDSAFISGTITAMDAKKLYGGIIADGFCPVILKNSYSVGYYAVPDTANTAGFVCENVYTDQTGGLKGQTVLATEQMMGITAKNHMAFDWDSRWQTVADGFPMPQFNAPTGEVIPWTVPSAAGVAEITYAGGTGISQDPYIIETADQLYKAVYEGGKIIGTSARGYFSVTKDIDLSNAGWYSPSKNALKNDVFTGFIEGNDHTIYNLKAQNDAAAGLIPKAAGSATVVNLHIKDSSILSSGDYAGALIGAIEGTSDLPANVIVLGCTVRNTDITGKWAAGITGAALYATVTISDCAFIGTEGSGGKITATQKVYGGIIAGGRDCTVTIKNSYSAGCIAAPANDNFTCKNVYTDKEGGQTDQKVLSIDQMQGKKAKGNMPDFDWNRAWYVVNNDFPVPYVNINNGEKGAVWSGKKAQHYAGGDGTEANPYQIETGEQLYKMAAENSNARYVLTADIRLNDVESANWAAKKYLNSWIISAATFSGHFDGQGHVITGLYIPPSGTKGQRGALFSFIASGATVQNVGLTQSYIDVSYNEECYGAAFVAYVENWAESLSDYTEDMLPYISQCFADSTVVIKAHFAGGIIAGLPSPAKVTNCYFNGTLNSDDRSGAILGNCWCIGSIVENCYAAPQSIYKFVYRARPLEDYSLKDNYHFGTDTPEGITFVPLTRMRGEDAKKYMPALNYENIWMTVDEGTPVLRIFGENAAAYSDKGGHLVTISFVTNVDGYIIPPITGPASTAVQLPVPTRYGYKFGGWFVYPEYQCEYDADAFPYINMLLYAKWIKNSIIQDFESYSNTEYDLDQDYVYYRPGVRDYDMNKVHGGHKSLCRKGDAPDEQDFLVNYEDELEPGRVYDLTYWMMTDGTNSGGSVSLVHATWPDIAEPDCGTEKIAALSGNSAGEWKEYKYTFTAKTPWIAIRTSGNVPIFFDDIMMVATGEVHEVSQAGIPLTGENACAVNIFISVSAVAVMILLISRKRTVKTTR